jgi:hypothetical protein
MPVKVTMTAAMLMDRSFFLLTELSFVVGHTGGMAIARVIPAN